MIRYWIARFLVRLALALSEVAVRKRETETANKVSVVVMMNALDRMAVPHCTVCPQTRGITFVAGRAFCNRHAPAMASDWIPK
ncbi:MAG: hypothetical protein E6Q97_34980 [Desulfurellales bacterium]|nr:MAG: hypothetical protein E6Q97_34980 [Desulfurellales bacterium]